MYYTTDELYHHGIKGQKWGVRRYQNEDGSVTTAGAKRYYGGIYGSNARYYTKKANRLQKRADSAKTMASMNEAAAKRQAEKKAEKKAANNTPEAIEARKKKAKRAAIIAGSTVVAAGLAAYGLKKLDDKATKGLAAKYEQKAKSLFFDSRMNNSLAERFISSAEAAKKTTTMDSKTRSAIVSNNRKIAYKYLADAKKANEEGWKYLVRSKGGFDTKEKAQYLADKLKKRRIQI